MALSTYRSRLIDSLERLSHKLDVPASVMSAAVKANPWFTPYYIHRSLMAIRTWLDATLLEAFAAPYPCAAASPRRVGIIAAGNLPLVGFHDVLVGLLCGHRVEVKYSHQDRVLLPWLMETLTGIMPELRRFFRGVPDIDGPDLLLATGSNNTARYLDARYSHVQRLVRRNRYSLAVLDDSWSAASLEALWEDILLYNGLGCRNVSNVVVRAGFDTVRWLDAAKTYKPDWLNPHYLEQVLHQYATHQVLEEQVYDLPAILVKPAAQPHYAEMGILYLVREEALGSIEAYIAQIQDQIQCVVGHDTQPGKTQWPELNDFADGVDTMALLSSC
ncbi:MAG: acyl-CoA reductase [Bacteroidia bacterium]